MFRRAAEKLEKLIKEQIPDAAVSVNPDKPRKGTFAVVANGTTVVELPSMPRPFKVSSLLFISM